jgi:hypothetical protein
MRKKVISLAVSAGVKASEENKLLNKKNLRYYLEEKIPVYLTSYQGIQFIHNGKSYG